MNRPAQALPGRVECSRPCPCGCTPTLKESESSGIQIIRLECACGERSACLMYTKPEDRARMIQAAWDGWNLAG